LALSALTPGCPPPEPAPLDAPRSDVPIAPPPDGGPLTCVADDECDDTLFCNGVERCRPGADGADSRGCLASRAGGCLAGQTCFEVGDRCVTECAVDEDADGDGVNGVECGGTDCDDSDADSFPGNPEVCDDRAHDEDCDTSTFGAQDFDRDGALDASCCNRDGTTLNCGTDCADYAASIRPGAPEVCDGRDQNCDGVIDEGVTVAGFADEDRDLHGDASRPIRACAAFAGFATVADDCDDTRVTVHGSQPEICDGVDNDCDGTVDEEAQPVTWYRDADGDGFGSARAGTTVSCAPVAGHSLMPTDCDDTRRSRSPLAREACNGLDDDCDGIAGFALGAADTEDDDGDGVADARCPSAAVRDCDDRDPFTYPGAPELCDHQDNDCDGSIESSLSPVDWYLDRDGDGWGDSAGSLVVSCEAVEGRVTRGGDCADRDASISPASVDACRTSVEGQDDDCDGRIDEGGGLLAAYLDGDLDGYGSGLPLLTCTIPGTRSVEGGDCDDAEPLRHPGGTEDCAALDGIDDDCDGLIDCEDADCSGAVGCGGAVRLELASGGGQTIAPLALSGQPIEVRAVDASTGAPVAGARVRVVLPPGLAVTEELLTADAGGRVRAFVRGGMSPGGYDVTFVAPGSGSLVARIHVRTPTFGTTATLIDALRLPGSEASTASSATHTVPASITGLAEGPAGELYVADGGRHCVYRVELSGALEVFAGRCGEPGGDGDTGLATAARFSSPGALGISRGRLVVADVGNRRVRAVDLSTRVVSTVGGGGLVRSPSVALGLARIDVRDLAIDEEQDVVVLDTRLPERLVHLNETTGLAEELLRDADIARLFGQGRPFVVRDDTATPRLYSLSRVGDTTTLIDTDIDADAGTGIDAHGNLLVVSRFADEPRVQRMTAFARVVTNVVGGGSALGDHVTSAEVDLATAHLTASFGGAVVVADENRLRVSWLAPAPPPTLTLTREGAAPPPGIVASPETLAFRVTSAGVGVAVSVEYEETEVGAAVSRFTGRTDGTGRATTQVLRGPSPGSHRFLVRVRDFAGRPAAGSPLAFDLRADAPAEGSLSYLIGPIHNGGSRPAWVSRASSSLALEADFGTSDTGLATDGTGQVYFLRTGYGAIPTLIAVTTRGASREVMPVNIPLLLFGGGALSLASIDDGAAFFVGSISRAERYEVPSGMAQTLRTGPSTNGAVLSDGTYAVAQYFGSRIDFIDPLTLAVRAVTLPPHSDCSSVLQVARLGALAADPRNGDLYAVVEGCSSTYGQLLGTFIVVIRAGTSAAEIVAGNPAGNASSTDPHLRVLSGLDEVALAVAPDGTIAFEIDEEVYELGPSRATLMHVAGGGTERDFNGMPGTIARLEVLSLAYLPDGRLVMTISGRDDRESPYELGALLRSGAVILW
jgi:hypothetical protein